MTKVIGVRFRQAGKIYFFAPGRYDKIDAGQHVIVETARGVEYGNVVLGIREVDDSKVVQPLKAVIRIATPEDDERESKNRIKEKEAFDICLEKIKKHNLDMKLIQVEYTFDNNKVLFYFTADGRIDFRELVKDLAAVFKTRIELRQIGVRDEAKLMGGIGVCGRPFYQISILCQLRWQRNRIFLLTQRRFQECVEGLCAALRTRRRPTRSLILIFLQLEILLQLRRSLKVRFTA